MNNPIHWTHPWSEVTVVWHEPSKRWRVLVEIDPLADDDEPTTEDPALDALERAVGALVLTAAKMEGRF